jgi:hypothetical protein
MKISVENFLSVYQTESDNNRADSWALLRTDTDGHEE